jgi:hypothetical protein
MIQLDKNRFYSPFIVWPVEKLDSKSKRVDRRLLVILWRSHVVKVILGANVNFYSEFLINRPVHQSVHGDISATRFTYPV